MKCWDTWLHEWVKPVVSRNKLCAMLTMAGLEVESVEDNTLDLSITPNRGDCLSIRGVAREVAALTKSRLKEPSIRPIKPSINDKLSIHVHDKTGCPRYVGRIIRQVKADVITPKWMRDRLTRGGVNCISPIVDVTNYVMLELGQPMHAFDLNSVVGGVHVRLAKKGERIALLDGSEQVLDEQTLLISDTKKALAIAGVMGGLHSCVTPSTQDILLESAFFSPQVVAKQRQRYGLNSDSAYRFERGVDPTIQRQAVERATQLILDICGGMPGNVNEIVNLSQIPKPKVILVTPEHIEKTLGMQIPAKSVESILKSLGFEVMRNKKAWRVRAPSYRFDVAIAEDVIEELARLYGYEHVPTHHIRVNTKPQMVTNLAPDTQRIRQSLVAQGFHEVVSYSFVDKNRQYLLNPEPKPIELLNPMTAEMSVMRTSLWPGLISSLEYNRSRQQQRVRLFEVGACFQQGARSHQYREQIGGVIYGYADPEQWGIARREADFYDLKGCIENLLHSNGCTDKIIFECGSHPALHPGQTAILRHGAQIKGVLGALNPRVLQVLDIDRPVFVFELELDLLLQARDVQAKEVSKFPEIRRDIAILIHQAVPSKDIQDTIKKAAGGWLTDVFIFDVYQGKGIAPGLKSVALGLLWQHPSRTLVDDEVTSLMANVTDALKGKLGAELRS